MYRRKFVALTGLGAVTATAGCAETLTGDGIVLTSEPAGLASEQVETDEFTLTQYAREQVQETITAGSDIPVEIDLSLVSYTLTEGSGLVFITTGSYEVATAELSPVYSAPAAQVIEVIASEIGAVEDVEETGEFETTHDTFGEVTVTEFTANAQEPVSELTSEITLYVAQAKTEETTVAIVGFHPEDSEHEDKIVQQYSEFVHPTPTIDGREPDDLNLVESLT